MIRTIFAATLAVSTLGLAQSASAAVIKFTADNGWTTGTIGFGNGTESVDVSARNVNTDGSIRAGDAPYLASWTGGGLGVCSGALASSATAGCGSDSHQMDGSGSDEIALFDFGALQVSITKVVFTHVYEGDDNFSLFNYGDGTGAAPTVSIKNKAIAGGQFQRAVAGFDSGVGSLFGIGALGGDDNFKIKKIVFTVVDSQQPQPVPLPAAGWMLLAGLGGLRLLRGRKA